MPTAVARLSRALIRVLPLYNGKGRIIDRTALRKLRFREATLDVLTSDGFNITVIPNDLIGRHIYLTGRFDRCVVDALVQFAKPGACLWDIGANIGYVSCAFLARVPGSRILAVEPLVDVAKILRQNVGQFGSSRSAVLEAAVSDRVGSGSIVSVDGNLGMSHVAETGQGQPTEFIDYQGLLVAGGPPDVIKIDVEGHEFAVLTGIAPAIEKHRPAVIVFEHHREGQPPDPRIVEAFSSLKYDLKRIWRRWSGWKLGPATGDFERGYEPSEDFAAVRRDI